MQDAVDRPISNVLAYLKNIEVQARRPSIRVSPFPAAPAVTSASEACRASSLTLDQTCVALKAVRNQSRTVQSNQPNPTI